MDITFNLDAEVAKFALSLIGVVVLVYGWIRAVPRRPVAEGQGQGSGQGWNASALGEER